MEEKERILIRIVTADYYLTSPSLEAGDRCYSIFRNSPVQSVPIIRIFGPTSEGHKTCVHVHGVYPYIFVPNWKGEIQQRDFYNVTSSLDTAINSSFGNPTSRTQHVYDIVKVFGRSFYGHHEEENEFLKIFFYNPVIAKKAAELLQVGCSFTSLKNGAVFKQHLQPYEAHISYLMQFFIDYNLYGMSFMDVSKGKYRKNADADSHIEIYGKLLSENGVSKQSYSKLEIDVKCSDILNTNNYQSDIASNPGLAFILEEEKRRNNGFSQSLSDTFSQPDIKHTKSHFYYLKKLDERLKRLKEETLVLEEEKGNISESELNNSDVMFTSQGEGIYNLLENLMKSSENREERNSLDIFSSLENDDKTNIENDSILDGAVLSDDEMMDIDEEDHEILSQSIVDLQHSSQFHCEGGDEISQLDGADGSPPNVEKQKGNCSSKRLLKKSRSFTESKKKIFQSRSPAEMNKSPKISYPQLQVYTPVEKHGNDTDPFSILKQFKNNTAQKILSFSRNKDSKNIMMTSSLNAPSILEIESNGPFHSDPNDVTCDEFPGSFGNRLNEIRAEIFKDVFNFSQNVDSDVLAPVRSVTLSPAMPPPSYDDAKLWIESRDEFSIITKKSHDIIERQYNTSFVNESMNMMNETQSCSYRIDEATYEHSGGFQMSLQDLQTVKTSIEHQNITTMSMELFVCNRGQLKPDPEFDEITAIFYTIYHDFKDSVDDINGAIVVTTNEYENFRKEWNVIEVENENILYDIFIKKLREYDPDIILGYEIEMSSWGYLIERGDKIGRNNMKMELSRILQKSWNNKIQENSLELNIIGRIVLNVWRLMRHEISLQSYTFENILFHVLHIRLPKHADSSLTQMWNSPLDRWIVMEYFLMRSKYNLMILNQLDLIGRTSEMAKLFGILFYEVLSRGSQFRVESMMLRMTKPSNYVLVSPNIRQRANMKAPSSLPLIMEPKSKYYSDPVIVLDFQSLYPSMIIAYNYCFSTCLGKIDHLGEKEPYEFGCITHEIGLKEMEKLRDNIHVTPCAVAFVDKNIKVGILPAMLQEILYTRLIVKKSMKTNKDDKALQRVLHARQLALKLIANVTYGYTAANFSGRMPCIEVGDSVVSKGRETLERAIELVTNTRKWKAQVIYGDTDSLFVLVKGRTREEAFEIGAEIADAVTNDNPNPVKLKLEKVYQPCILQTKKRYVGYLYENSKQEIPIYDAKGIETVRRDGCPAIAKILKKSLKILMNTCDLSLVKKYVQKQFSKIISGKISIQELTFAREYRGLDGYRPSACVPALHLARQALLKDRRGEPRKKERVPYVIVAGAPGVTLIKLVRSPDQVLNESWMKVNVEYYITRAIIPPLERCFALIGVDVNGWYKELPRRYELSLPVLNDKKNTISQYFHVNNCLCCRKVTTNDDGVCPSCMNNPQMLAVTSSKLINTLQRNYTYVNKICESCCGRKRNIDCISLDCSVLYRKYQTQTEKTQIDFIQNIQEKYLSF